MIVTHISFSDNNGGANIAAYRLHCAMKESGVTSNLLVLQKNTKDDSIIKINTQQSNLKIIYSIIKNKLKRLLTNKKQLITKGAFSQDCDGFEISNHFLLHRSDIIYIHWINNNMLSIRNIKNILKLQKPTLWFMHDMWPITGGCHHSFDCNKYQKQCCYCPNLYSTKRKDISYELFNKKNKTLNKFHNLYFITPSKWLKQCVQKSLIFNNHKVTVIPNIVDNNTFKPVNKLFAKNILSINPNKHILLFGAGGGINNPYKGWEFLKKALYYLDKDKYEIIIFGNDLTQSDVKEIPLKTYTVGTLRDKTSLVLAYNAADAFIIPSLAENFAQTILESMACGTPVIGFNIGGIPDAIKHKENGYLAKYKNEKDLAIGIKWILEDKDRYKKISERARNDSSLYSPNIIIRQHKELWNTL